MSTQNNGGPAFPRPGFEERAGQQEGMTLRDYFAAKAMQAFMENSAQTIALGEIAKKEGKDVTAVISRMAYIYADAMLRARQS